MEYTIVDSMTLNTGSRSVSMSNFIDKKSPLGTIWNAGLVTHGRKSNKQKRFEKSLTGIKSNILCVQLTDVQDDISLRVMSRLLFGITKIINIQSSSIYQTSIQLLGSIHREMGAHKVGIDLDLAGANVHNTTITLGENPYLAEYSTNIVRVWNETHETQSTPLDTFIQQEDGITLPVAPNQSATPNMIPSTYVFEDQQLLKDRLIGGMNQPAVADEFASGPSRQPQPSVPRTTSSHGMGDQIVSVGHDSNMDDYMNWSDLFNYFGQDVPQRRSDSTAGGSRRVPFISPGVHQRHQHVNQDLSNAPPADLYDINSPIWDLSGLSISPPPLDIPPPEDISPPGDAPWLIDEFLAATKHLLDDNDSNSNNNSQPMPQRAVSPVTSLRTADYPHIVPQLNSPIPSPTAQHPCARRRRGLVDHGSTTLPISEYNNIRDIVAVNPHEESNDISTHGHQSRTSALKQLVTQYRSQMRQPKMMIQQPTRFWLREARNTRRDNTGIDMDVAIEHGRRLEQGRNRDPHSQSDLVLSNAGDDSDTHRLSRDMQIAQEDYDFPQMELVDDIRSNNTSTSSAQLQQQRRLQQLQGTRTSNGSSGHPFSRFLGSVSTSGHGPQGTVVSSEPNYEEVLEMGVHMHPPDSTGQEFYEYLRLATRDQLSSCTFDQVFPKGIDGCKRSEAALAFYHVLTCSSLGHIRPEQDEPYGQLYLHLLRDDVL
ncbi:hypothetical protein BCR42DRAFT_489108 [Absidia repens]|uniref:Rad21/Rec8-like protein N-terminal domain-containing protein n=1 Tax=Absidia repens TaxID=90262 RepID=A0A1X2IQN7_9FUNG|nr:hypothetical protein BCR42DRAFT_489108 [Absidia repens]